MVNPLSQEDSILSTVVLDFRHRAIIRSPLQVSECDKYSASTWSFGNRALMSLIDRHLVYCLSNGLTLDCPRGMLAA